MSNVSFSNKINGVIIKLIMNQTIDRNASDKTKGFRFQKLRAVKLVLETIDSNDNCLFFINMESLGDINLKSSINYVEEDKNYDASTSFTINSSEVLNSLVYFFDIWYQEWLKSKKIFFGFYSTCKIGKEKITEKTKHLKLPSKPILEILQGKKIDNDTRLFVKNVLLSEYTKQYKLKNRKGFLSQLNSISDDDFDYFLNSIDWCFEQGDENSLELELVEKIKSSKYFNSGLDNKEKTILATLCEEIETRQTEKDLVSRYIPSSQIELIFRNAASFPANKKNDATWKIWLEMDQPDDKRGLSEKINSVCSDFNKEQLKIYLMKACCSKVDESEANDKHYKAKKYRIYLYCFEQFYNFVKSNNSKQITELDIVNFIRETGVGATDFIKNLSENYYYPSTENDVCLKTTTEGILLDLMDECFLAFD